MLKILLPVVLLTSAAFAQTSSEEAVILNQELQFLENSASDIRPEPLIAEESTEKTDEEISLERAYFSDEERDVIRTRAAAPKRVRSF